MSEQIRPILTVSVVAVMFAWAPFLNLVCQRWVRRLERRRLKKAADELQRSFLGDLSQ